MQRQGSNMRFIAAFRRLLKVALLVLLFYLVQTSVVPHLMFRGIIPNLLMVCIAIMTVSLGKKYAFASGATIGILLESMLPDMRLFNLLIYPSLALICAQVFADMSELKRELKRIRLAQRQADTRKANVELGYRQRRFRISLRRNTANDLDPHLRIFMNTLMLTALYEGVMLIYVMLTGVPFTFAHLVRVFYTLAYTAVFTLLMFPARAFLGMYRRRKRGVQLEGVGELVDISEKDLRKISLEPDLPLPTSSFRVSDEPLIKGEDKKTKDNAKPEAGDVKPEEPTETDPAPQEELQDED